MLIDNVSGRVSYAVLGFTFKGWRKMDYLGAGSSSAGFVSRRRSALALQIPPL